MSRAEKDFKSLPRAVRVGATSKSELLETLRRSHVQLNRAAESLFEDGRFTTLDRPHAIEIVARTVAELGLTDGGTYEAVTARARESGLLECPLEVGPHLRLQFLDQAEPVGAIPTANRAPPGSITIASSPLDDSDETPKGFYLRRIDGLPWLRGYCSWSGHIWSPDDVLVFSSASGAA